MFVGKLINDMFSNQINKDDSYFYSHEVSMKQFILFKINQGLELNDVMI